MIIEKRPNNLRIVYQTERKEAKENNKTTKGSKSSKGVIRKFQPRKSRVCIPVKLLNQLSFHNNKVSGKEKRIKCKPTSKLVKKNTFP